MKPGAAASPPPAGPASDATADYEDAQKTLAEEAPEFGTLQPTSLYSGPEPTLNQPVPVESSRLAPAADEQRTINEPAPIADEQRTIDEPAHAAAEQRTIDQPAHGAEQRTIAEPVAPSDPFEGSPSASDIRTIVEPASQAPASSAVPASSAPRLPDSLLGAPDEPPGSSPEATVQVPSSLDATVNDSTAQPPGSSSDATISDSQRETAGGSRGGGAVDAKPGSSKPGVLRSGRGSHETPSPKSSSGGGSKMLHSGISSVKPGEEALQSFDDGKYVIIKEIARGGMGAVYKARQVDLNRVVALKVMLSGALASDAEKKRFLREAEASAKLKHANIVPVYDIGEVDGNLYFTMDFVEGAPLSEKKKEFNRDQLLEVMIKVCDAVAYAHMRGIIHRDLKPANIMIDKRNEPLIMDFGLAKETTTEQESGAPDLRTREGSIMGTPHYMPPEQAEGLVSEIDVRSDVYALGVILFELWTGALPFNAKRIAELMRMVIEQEPPAPRSLDPSVPWEVEAIALKAMEKQKAKRYDSAMEMKRDLERFKTGEPIGAAKANFFYALKKSIHRNRYKIGAGAVAVAAVSLALGLAIRESNKAERERHELALTRFAKVTRDLDTTSSVVATLEPEIAALRSGALGARLDACQADDARVGKVLESLATTRAELEQVSTDVGADASKRSTDAEALKARLTALHTALVAVSDDEKAEKSRVAKVAQARENALAALARAEKLHGAAGVESDAAERTEIEAARSACFRAIALNAEAEVAPTLKKVQGLDVELSQRIAQREHRRNAEQLLDKGAAALADAQRAFDAAKLDEALEGTQSALKLLGDGQKEDGTLAALEQKRDDAQYLYARTLEKAGYLSLCEIAAKAVKGERGERLAREAHDAGAIALANKNRLAEAGRVVQIAGSQKNARDAAAAADMALEKLALLKDAVLSHDDALTLADLRKKAETDSAMGHAQELVDVAEAFDQAHPESDQPALADKNWEAALGRIEGLGTLLDAASVGGMSGHAQVLRGRMHLRAAERLQKARDARGALNEATLAQTFLRAGKAEADLKAADEIARVAAREIATPEGMILVPELPSVALGGDDRNPARTATVPAFYVGRLEVTNDEFARFVKEGGYTDARADLWDPAAPRASFVDRTKRPGPADWENGEPPRGREKMPVANVSFYEAQAFARFVGRRLPTDEEWEVAARVERSKDGVVVHVFPWGDLWGEVGAELSRCRSLAPVRPDGAHESDRSSIGCCDMAGNVAEWVNPSTDKVVPCAEGSAPVRGGSFLFPLPDLVAARHRALPARTLRAPNVGLRLAMTPPEKAPDKKVGDK